MNIEKIPFDYPQQELYCLSQHNWSPTPIGPNATVEIVDIVPTDSLLEAMDHTTTVFLKETFNASTDCASTCESLDVFKSNRIRGKLSDLAGLSENDSIDKLPEMQSCEMAIAFPVIPLSNSFVCSVDSIGGINSKKDHWSEKFDELVDFRKRFGHCLVPNNWIENVKLSQWVKRQRHQYKLKREGKNSSLCDEKIIALESIGFTWSVQEDTWEERFQQLVEYKEFYGHTNVPKNCTRHPQLSVWVKYQRRHLRLFMSGERSSMTEERFYKLTKLGFQWNPRREKREGSETVWM